MPRLSLARRQPAWLAGVMRHGYKGAVEMAATVDYLFGYDATAEVLDDWMYERLAAGLPVRRSRARLPAAGQSLGRARHDRTPAGGGRAQAVGEARPGDPGTPSQPSMAETKRGWREQPWNSQLERQSTPAISPATDRSSSSVGQCKLIPPPPISYRERCFGVALCNTGNQTSGTLRRCGPSVNVTRIISSSNSNALAKPHDRNIGSWPFILRSLSSPDTLMR